MSLKYYYCIFISLMDLWWFTARFCSSLNFNVTKFLLPSRMHSSYISEINFPIFQAFIAPDITFAMKPYFRNPFCNQDVREGLVVGFIRHISNVCNVRFYCLDNFLFKENKVVIYFNDKLLTSQANKECEFSLLSLFEESQLVVAPKPVK